MKKLLVVSLIAVLAMSGSALAWDHAYHIKEAPNGKGDVLIFPAYFAAPGGWETKLTVTNTSTTYSVVAKIIFRSQVYSEELLDFLLYLTPTDVWTGYVRHDGTNVYIYSEDDSVLISSSEFASAAKPFRQNFFSVDCPAVDNASLGYAEVIEAWYGDVSANYPAPNNSSWRRTRPVSKLYLRQLYDPERGVLGCANCVAGLTGTAGENSNGLDHTINVLTGMMEIQNSGQPGMTSAMKASVFADFDLTAYLNVKEATTLAMDGTRNTIGEVEAAMSKGEVALPYVNSSAGAVTAHLFNFPTKLSNYNQPNTTNPCAYVNGTGPYWVDPTPVSGLARSSFRCQSYVDPAYDLSENENMAQDIVSGGYITKTMCQEVALVTTSGYPTLFNEGWTRYNWTLHFDRTLFNVKRAENNPPDFAYEGLPVLPFALMIKNGGLALVEGAYNKGRVFASATTFDDDPNSATFSWLPDYQYWNAMPQLGLNFWNAATTAYPEAEGAAACGTAGVYWDTTNAAACLPVEFPRR